MYELIATIWVLFFGSLATIWAAIESVNRAKAYITDTKYEITTFSEIVLRAVFRVKEGPLGTKVDGSDVICQSLILVVCAILGLIWPAAVVLGLLIIGTGFTLYGLRALHRAFRKEQCLEEE